MDNNDSMEDETTKIREMLNDYVSSSPYNLNPDTKIVDRVIKGLVMRKSKYGYFYCPCRIVTGDAEKDGKTICPCVYHIEEIERDGECHCNLFVRGN